MVDISQAIAELNEKRSKMTLVELIEDIESRHFRTAHDTGANFNALMIWNMIRGAAGLPKLTTDDLWQRHADDQGWTQEDINKEKKFWKEFNRFEHLRSLADEYNRNQSEIAALPKSYKEFFDSRKEN